jgi:hypothetical protein
MNKSLKRCSVFFGRTVRQRFIGRTVQTM